MSGQTNALLLASPRETSQARKGQMSGFQEGNLILLATTATISEMATTLLVFALIIFICVRKGVCMSWHMWWSEDKLPGVSSLLSPCRN